MMGCFFFYHTGLGQNTFFHNFARQIALIQQYSGPIEVHAFFAQQIIELTTL